LLETKFTAVESGKYQLLPQRPSTEIFQMNSPTDYKQM